MTNTLQKFMHDTEDIFEDSFETENDELKKALANLLNELPEVKDEEWLIIFRDLHSRSFLYNIHEKENLIIAISKIIRGYAKRNKYAFSKEKKEIYFYTSRCWLKLDNNLLKEFLKTASSKICISEYIASGVLFINKLCKQFEHDIYFEKCTNKNISYINLKNGTLVIDKDNIKFEQHNPKHNLCYILDYDYSENENMDNSLDTIKALIPSVNVRKTLQQSISQVFIKDVNNGKKICLNGANRKLTDEIIYKLKEVILQELISNHFENQNAKLEDLFIEFKDINKDAKSLEKIVFIPCNELLNNNIPKNIYSSKSAVLNWLIDGAKEILQNKSVYIAKECEEFKDRCNIISLFVKETHLINTPKDSKSIVTTYEKVFKQYEIFCELHDEELLGKTKFNRELKALGLKSTRRETGNVWFAKFA